LHSALSPHEFVSGFLHIKLGNKLKILRIQLFLLHLLFEEERVFIVGMGLDETI